MQTIAILSPCYNESSIVESFLNELEETLGHLVDKFIVTLVDDNSTDSTVEILKKFQFKKDNFELKIIKLKSNCGHQEAIRQGLIFLDQLDNNFGKIVVMDSDGEDNPQAILEMLTIESNGIIFVQRGKRSEGQLFKIGYFVYKILFKILTGYKINYGNYSMISRSVLNAISGKHFIHFPGFLSKQKEEKIFVIYDRRKRIDGTSKMNTNSLILHGLYSLVELSEEVIIALIKFFLFILLNIILLFMYVLYARFIAHSAIPGWASFLSLNLITICIVMLSTIMLSLISLAIKKNLNHHNNGYEKIK